MDRVLCHESALHAVQQAFIDHDGFQCGYCTPGQICPAVGMLDEVTRQQMFCLAGYRTPTIQRLRLGADERGRLTAIVHEVIAPDKFLP